LPPFKFPRRLRENLGLLNLIDEFNDINGEESKESSSEEAISSDKENENGFFKTLMNVT